MSSNTTSQFIELRIKKTLYSDEKIVVLSQKPQEPPLVRNESLISNPYEPPEVRPHPAEAFVTYQAEYHDPNYDSIETFLPDDQTRSSVRKTVRHAESDVESFCHALSSCTSQDALSDFLDLHRFSISKRDKILGLWKSKLPDRPAAELFESDVKSCFNKHRARLQSESGSN